MSRKMLRAIYEEDDMSCRYLFVCFGLLILGVGCAAPTATDTRNADVAAIKEVEAAWVKDTATKDVDKFTSYYADDVAVLNPNAPMVTGRANARDAFRPMFADPNFALTFQSVRVEASKGGDLAYAVGTYSMTTTDPKDKKPVTDKGKYITVFKKQADGSWKAVADTFNSDMPAPAAQAQ